jgi:hypothetical protein
MRVTSVIFDSNDRPEDTDRSIALAINEAIRRPLSTHLNRQRRRARNVALVAGTLVVVGVLLLVGDIGGVVGLLLPLVGLIIGVVGYVWIQSNEADITITGVDKNYWTGYRIPTENGTVLYDATDGVANVELDLEMIADMEAVADTSVYLDELQHSVNDTETLPVVMDRDREFEERFLDNLWKVRAELSDANTRTVSAPFITADTAEWNAVDRLADHADASATKTSVDVAPEDAEADVTALTELEEMAAERDDADLKIISTAGQAVADTITDQQERSIAVLNDHISTVGDTLGLVSYNFYCPECLRDDVESQLTFDNSATERLHCDTCRSTLAPSDAVARHCIKDDLVNPVWDQLWAEKDDERRQIYENIEDQKTDLEEREFEQRREEIRASEDRIKELRNRIRDLRTEADAAEGKVREIGELMVKYDRLREQRKREFEAEIAQTFDDIEAEVDRLIDATRDVHNDRIETARKKAEKKAQVMREEKRKREAEKQAAQAEAFEDAAEAIMEQEAKLTKEQVKNQQQQTNALAKSIAASHQVNTNGRGK